MEYDKFLLNNLHRGQPPASEISDPASVNVKINTLATKLYYVPNQFISLVRLKGATEPQTRIPIKFAR